MVKGLQPGSLTTYGQPFASVGMLMLQPKGLKHCTLGCLNKDSFAPQGRSKKEVITLRGEMGTKKVISGGFADD